MRTRIQKAIAVGIMILGSFVGFWMASSTNPSATAQVEGGAGDLPLPPPDQALPPMDLPPPDMGFPPPDPNMPPSTGDFPPPEGNPFPPELPQGGEQMPLMEQGGFPMQAPDDLMMKTDNPEGFIYNPEGLRDPFLPTRKGREDAQPIPEIKPPNEIDFNPQDPLQAFSLVEYRLVGVMWDVRDPRAMVQTPDGKVFTIRRKIRLGREGAVVAAIRESEIVIVEPNPDGTYVNATTRVIPMRK